jgi:adenylate cyclase
MISKEYEAASEEFEQAIDLDANNFDAYYFFARCKVHEGDPQHAIALFQRASEVRPDDYQSLLLPSQLYVSLGDEKGSLRHMDMALERIRAVLDIRPGDVRARNLGAFVLLRLGQQQEAVSWMETSLELSPSDSIVDYNAACFYSLAGEKDKALDYLEKSAASGGANKGWLLQDSDLDAVRGEDRFEKIVASISD